MCIRYSSEYAARVSSGAWRAKKHKPLAIAAVRLWKQLKQHKAGRLWMLHAPASDPFSSRAQALAEAGKRGTTECRAL